jgi:hypothetical protein
MLIEHGSSSAGLSVHLEPDECELFMSLARDAAKASYSGGVPTYFSACVKLGERISALLNETRAHDVSA